MRGEVVRFHHSMVNYIREYMLAGLTGNADIARILGDAYKKPITTDDVARWRRQHPRMDMVCVNSVDHMDAIAVGVVSQAIKDGSTSDAWRWLERRNPNFKPASKVDMSGRVEGLGDMLARRTTNAELIERGVLEVDDGD